MLFAVMVLKAMMHLLALVPLPESLPNLLQAMPLPLTLLMLLAAPLAPMLKKPSLLLPVVT